MNPKKVELAEASNSSYDPDVPGPELEFEAFEWSEFAVLCAREDFPKSQS